jgi:hypothetical protein
MRLLGKSRVRVASFVATRFAEQAPGEGDRLETGKPPNLERHYRTAGTGAGGLFMRRRLEWWVSDGLSAARAQLQKIFISRTRALLACASDQRRRTAIFTGRHVVAWVRVGGAFTRKGEMIEIPRSGATSARHVSGAKGT